jgi:FHS family L-fucose permease-like MFS transporter
LGLLLSALGSGLFYPAAEINQYWLYLAALFIVGLGFTLLQISANPYVAILGDPKNASSRLNFAQGFNSVGTTIGPLIGGWLIFKFFAGAQAAKYPYLGFAVLFLLIALWIKLMDLPEYSNEQEIARGAKALRYPQLVLGIIAIFFYVGAEVSIGSMMINFLKLPQIGHMTNLEASTYVSVYWGGLMIGRFLGSVSLNQDLKAWTKYLTMFLIALAGFGILALTKGLANIRFYAIVMIINLLGFIVGKSLPDRTLGIFAIINVLLLSITLAFTGKVAMWAVLGIGLFNSVMWSNIFTLAIADLEQYTAQGSSLLVMAIVGGAIIPLIQGKVADTIGLHKSYIVPIVSYLYICFYGFYGSKLRPKRQL